MIVYMYFIVLYGAVLTSFKFHRLDYIVHVKAQRGTRVENYL